MIVPIRCFSCGALIGDKFRKFIEYVNSGMDPKEALDKLGLERYCCRRMILTHVDVIDKLIKYRRFGEIGSHK